MSLAWDVESERVVIECFAEGMSVGEEEEDEDGAEETADGSEEEGAVLRVSITGATARAFAKRALVVVSAGRPPCPFCSLPLDLEGHICPRSNGYRR
jgi:uncharacterized repeat protein (TIGR03847 family)